MAKEAFVSKLPGSDVQRAEAGLAVGRAMKSAREGEMIRGINFYVDGNKNLGYLLLTNEENSVAALEIETFVDAKVAEKGDRRTAISMFTAVEKDEGLKDEPYLGNILAVWRP